MPKPGTGTHSGRPQDANGALPAGQMLALAVPDHTRLQIVEITAREGLDIDFFATIDELFETKGDPPLILLGVEQTGASLPKTVESLTQRCEHAAIVLICPGIERWEIRAALTAGAAGVVLCRDLDAALAPCMQAVMAGQTCVPRDHWRQIEPPALSTREKQILGLVVMGYMNSQIAEQLFLAESTVKSHLSSAFGKLGVRSRNEAVSLILDPERGLGMGILALGGQPLDSAATTAR
jgi:DNA-binding NarL/FixJ family response regulator